MSQQKALKSALRKTFFARRDSLSHQHKHIKEVIISQKIQFLINRILEDKNKNFTDVNFFNKKTKINVILSQKISLQEHLCL